METSNVSSVLSTLVQQTEATSKSALSTRAERERGLEAAERTQGPRRGGELLKALSETLGQFGIEVPSANGGSPATASQANDAESAAANSRQGIEQALQGFAFSLFQALGTAGNAAPPRAGASGSEQQAQVNPEAVSARGRRAYDDIESRLQNLVQNLSQPPSAGGGRPNQAASTNTSLESAFENLSKTFQSVESGTGSAKMPDLQSFLQTLKQNIQNAGSRLDSSGNLVNTIA